jgi:DNA-binding transcriptional ArsR family regulator
MKSLVTSLSDAVAAEPWGLRASQIIQQIGARCLQLLTHPEDEGLSAFAESSAAAARELRPSDLDSPELWQVWYAGQLQAMAGLCRMLLRAEIPDSVRRKVLAPNFASIILALDEEDELTQNQLLSQISTNDPSQLSREIAKLQELRVVDVARDGRRSWVRLSSLGRRIATAPAIREKLMRVARRFETRAAVAASGTMEPTAVEAESARATPAAPPGRPESMVRRGAEPISFDDSRARMAVKEKAAIAATLAEPQSPRRRKTQEQPLPVVLLDEP